jgi:hypothetical protein
MSLFSFKGHYPVPFTGIDKQDGWYEVPDKPEAPEGKQVAWLNGEWVVRDPKPEDRPGYQWNWNHTEMAWVECEYAIALPEGEVPEMVFEPTPVTASAVTSNEFDITVNGEPI